jgi:adenylate kinase
MSAYVVLLGPPGSGKGTQAKRLVQELAIPQVSTGDLFRAMKHDDTPLARKVQAIMASGDLVPDDVTIEIVRQRLAEDDCADGAILDGFPRTVAQAGGLDKMLADGFNASVTIVPLLHITEDEAVRRISGRRACQTCGAIYHVEFNPPRQEGVCDVDGGQLFQREDDKPETVRARYRVYLENTEPLIGFYRQRSLLEEIDATADIEQITADLLVAIHRRQQGG